MDSLPVTFIIISAVLLCASVVLLILFLKEKKNVKLLISKNREFQTKRNMILTNVSHEIRTPLNTIIGLSELISHESGISEDIHAKIDDISSAGNTLFNVVYNMVDVVKLESGELELIENEYDTKEMLNLIVQKAVAYLGDKNIDLISDISSEIPSKLIGDDVRIVQAVSNILSNAVKFTYSGVITIKAYAEDVFDGECTLKVTVDDTGVGISDAEQAGIFDSFMKHNSTDDYRKKGAGLGLIIAKNLAELMNGSISFTSEEGTGSSFTLAFNQKISDDSPMGSFGENVPGRSVKYAFTAPMARILVVDDNMVNLFVTSEMLKQYDIEITTCVSGAECLNLLNDNFYDLIFMDYVMPEMDGHETLLQIRKNENEYLRKIPVVALTAQTFSRGAKIYVEEGFQGYLAKPVNVNELENILITMLPEEYIMYKDEAVAKQNDVEPIEEKAWYKRVCNVLTDIDVKKGLEYCNNDYTTYINFLRVVENDSYDQCEKLNSSMKEHNWEEYRITVHAMKSVTASAGAQKLSFICQEHEKAAKNSDDEYIFNHFQTLEKEYTDFIKKIETLLRREDEMMKNGLAAHKADIPKEKLDELIDLLLEALDDYNIDDAEKQINIINTINLDFEQERAVEVARNQLLGFKYEDAAQSIKKVFK